MSLRKLGGYFSRLLYPLLLLFLIFLFNWKTQDIVFQKIYDFGHDMSPIESIADVNVLLDQFEKVPFSAVDKTYLKETISDSPPYDNMLAGSAYLLIDNKSRYQKIAGNFRIKDFMPKDKYYKKTLMKRNSQLYWLIDKKLLYKTLALRSELKNQNFNQNAFKIVNGHRHPAYNQKVGGASQSRHIVGEAVDISVGDINQDGKITTADKDIVLDILENVVIKNEGGIGRYPHSKTAIHYDVRGYRARWDKQ